MIILIRLGNPVVEIEVENTLVVGGPGSGKTEMIRNIRDQLEYNHMIVVEDIYGPSRLNLVENVVKGKKYFVEAQSIKDVPEEIRDLFNTVIVISQDKSIIAETVGTDELVPQTPFQAVVKTNSGITITKI